MIMTTTTKVIVTCISFQVIALSVTIYIYHPQFFGDMLSFPLGATKKIGGNIINHKE